VDELQGTFLRYVPCMHRDPFRDANMLVRLRKDSRAALLSSKRAIDSQSKSQRDELLASAAVAEKRSGNEKVT
jgi:hypothetical protein